MPKTAREDPREQATVDPWKRQHEVCDAPQRLGHFALPRATDQHRRAVDCELVRHPLRVPERAVGVKGDQEIVAGRDPGEIEKAAGVVAGDGLGPIDRGLALATELGLEQTCDDVLDERNVRLDDDDGVRAAHEARELRDRIVGLGLRVEALEQRIAHPLAHRVGEQHRHHGTSDLAIRDGFLERLRPGWRDGRRFIRRVFFRWRRGRGDLGGGRLRFGRRRVEVWTLRHARGAERDRVLLVDHLDLAAGRYGERRAPHRAVVGHRRRYEEPALAVLAADSHRPDARAQLLELGRHRLPVRRQQLEFRFQQREGAIRAAQEEHEEPQVVEHDLCVEHQAFGRVGSMYRVGSPYERQHRVVAVEEVAHADLIATRDPHFDQRMTGIEPRPQIARDLELPAVIDVWRFLAQARQQLSGAGLVEVDPGEADPELLLHPESLSNAPGDGCAQSRTARPPGRRNASYSKVCYHLVSSLTKDPQPSWPRTNCRPGSVS